MKNYINNKEEILGYDCDGNEIREFRILRFLDSANIENWDEEPNIDPRFYCLVRSNKGEIVAISVYDDYNSEYIKEYEQLKFNEKIPTIIKTVSEMEYYEVAFSGITGDEWYYDRDRNELRKKLENFLKIQSKYTKKLIKKI